MRHYGAGHGDDSRRSLDQPCPAATQRPGVETRPRIDVGFHEWLMWACQRKVTPTPAGVKTRPGRVADCYSEFVSIAALRKILFIFNLKKSKKSKECFIQPLYFLFCLPSI